MSLDYYVQKIREGGVVAFPTETVYGLGADAWNPDAVRKIFEIKGRPADNPLIVHISKPEWIDQFAESINDEAYKLIDRFWPGPLTLIFKKKPQVLDMITAGLDSVAIRMPNHKLALELIDQTGPLVAPSANISGRPSPTRPSHVKTDFGDVVPVIDGGICDVGIESTVLDISHKPFEIYRPGYISKSDIEETIKQPIRIHKTGEQAGKVKSPGMKYSHYAPKARVFWLKTGEDPNDPDILYLIHSKENNTGRFRNIITYNGDYRLFTKELYDRFRQADREGYMAIAIEPFIETKSEELALAVLNRIKKAIGNN